MLTQEANKDSKRAFGNIPLPPINNVLDVPIENAIDSYIAVITGNNKESSREPGLFVTRTDQGKINALMDYINTLPTTLPQIKQYLGYSQSGVPDLDPFSIQRMHEMASNLVMFWSFIEPRMKQAATDLIAFSTTLDSIGSEAIRFIENLTEYDIYQSAIGNVTDIQLNTTDKERIPSLLVLSEDLLEAVKLHIENAAGIKERMGVFVKGLNELLDDINVKQDALRTHQIEGQYTDKIEALDRLNARISELLRSYKKYSTYTWVGAWWGPVGLVISASIFGPEAAALKNEMEQRTQEKDQLEVEIKKTNVLLGSFIGLQNKLQTFELSVLAAQNGAQNIEDIWLLIHSHLAASVQQMKNNKNATTLMIFKSRLSGMMEHWKKIHAQAASIIFTHED